MSSARKEACEHYGDLFFEEWGNPFEPYFCGSYVAFSRGYTEETYGLLRVIPCSMEFLDTIVNDYSFITLLTGLQSVEQYEVALAEHLETIETEIVRLEDNPVLYPSARTRMEFLAEIATVNYKTKEVEHIHRMLNHAEQEVHEHLSQICAEPYRRSFNKQRKPWQQFLHHGAPGSGLNIYPPYRGSIQMLPTTGLQILSQWRTDYLSMARDLGQERSCLIALTKSASKHSKEPDYGSGFLFRTLSRANYTRFLSDHLMISTRAYGLPQNESNTVTLEDLTRDFCLLEGEPITRMTQRGASIIVYDRPFPQKPSNYRP